MLGGLKRFRIVSISHETIYQHVWDDRRYGGDLHTNLRQASKKRRKRYANMTVAEGLQVSGRSRLGRIGAENRSRLGHWEMDTVLGSSKASILTLVERKTGNLQIAKLTARTKEEVFKAMMLLTHRHRRRYLTITADNGCEFHGDREIEEKLSMRFYFAPPHHSWERGTNENTAGLIRQYLPKATSMEKLTQEQCDWIATELNERPRERYNFLTPNELFLSTASVALHS
ncbi:IS30 family transposase [Haloferula luteola]|nr:IS30 family transposase [Haloferula luteola]